jgi:hypothetical protein
MGLIVETKDGGFYIIPTWLLLLGVMGMIMMVSVIAGLLSY